MRKTTFAVCLILLTFSFIFPQSRRPTTDEGGKKNQRPAATPTPQPTDENAELDEGVIEVNTEIVTIPVKVLDRKSKFVAGLTKEDFKVFEENVEQEISYFSNEQEPFTVALVLDMSYSAKFKEAEIQSAAIAFLNELSPKDHVMIIAFTGEVRVLCEPTNDKKRLYAAIKSTKIDFGTSVYDAVDLVLNDKLAKIGGRKAIVLFSDGVDTSSERASDLSNKSNAIESDSLIYVVQYDTFAEVQAMKNKPIVPQTTQIPGKDKNPFPIPNVGMMSDKGTSREEYDKADQYLSELAMRTGGEVFKANDIVSISKSFSKVAAELREFYSIGFSPKEESKDGKRRKLKVKVNRENVAVKARDSYTAKKKKESLK